MESNINDQPEMYFLSFIRTSLPKSKKYIKSITDGRIEKLPKGADHREKLTNEPKESLCDILEEKGANDPKKILARKEYVMNFLRIAQDRQKVFFIDETGFQANMICRYGRELTGIRATSRSGITVLKDMVNFKISDTAYNTEWYLEYRLEIFEIFLAREI
ncbi:hypothetical protein RF11_12945 [Thelohanellus kitauei]|uniref:Tc1-like transposase DDE domain-containing protein n=1 Tax=Thelohanellus kitauei TaxID=669202 RepID=A0A0C2NIN6_THEKT|nr:hypothetical protein RF11_12945 [Thelohanellus kitauei]